MPSLLDSVLLLSRSWGGGIETVNDDYLSSPEQETLESWTGTTTFLTSTASGSSSDLILLETTIVGGDDFASSRPWDGEKPPTSIYAYSSIFIRRDDGIWCRRDTRGRLYLVNAHGERCSKPKIFEQSSGQYNDQRRPDGISSYVWWNMMHKDERKQWWISSRETSG